MSERVEEARDERILARMVLYDMMTDRNTSTAQMTVVLDAIDAHEDAVRADERERVRGIVEGMERLGDDGFDNLVAKKDGWLLNREAVLAALSPEAG